MRHFAVWYRKLMLALDSMAEKEPKKSKKEFRECKYILASVFPDQETMDMALNAIKKLDE